jgi:hypothetical protein
VECEHAQQVVADVVMLRDMAAGRFDEQRVRQTAEVLPHLVSRSIKVCGFVPMLGAGEHRERTLWLRDCRSRCGSMTTGLPVRTCSTGHWKPSWPATVSSVKRTRACSPRTDAWSGVTIGRHESFDTPVVAGEALGWFCQLTVNTGQDRSLPSPVNLNGTPAVTEGASPPTIGLCGSGGSVRSWRSQALCAFPR